MPRNKELESKRESFIEELINNPIENDLFIATFSKKSPHSGEVTFQDKVHDRTVKALWGVYIDNENIKATLDNERDPIIDLDYNEYRSFISNSMIIKHPLEDLKKAALD
jgi:hypothetical protein